MTPDVKEPTILPPQKGPIVVSLPLFATGLPGVAVLDTTKLPKDLGLPEGDKLLLVNLPGSSLLIPKLTELARFGDGIFAVLLDQVAPVSQLFATATTSNLLATVSELVDGLVAEAAGSPASTPGVAGPSGSIAALGASNLWVWNGVSAARTEHSGFSFEADAGNAPVSGSTLPARSTDRAELPGILWDASSKFGYPRGTVFFGATGGVTESDIELESNAPLNDLEIEEAGAVELTSWSAGGFALFIAEIWYAGATAGGSWGSADTESFLTGAESDYDLTSYTSSAFLGTIVPLNEMFRLDLRATLLYQRTEADAHTDTLGVAYGEHTIDAASLGASARLFAVLTSAPGLTLRPYVQVGGARRFHYDNDLDVSGVDFAFNDARTGVFAAGGVDYEVGGWLHLSAGLRKDYTSDFDSLSARFGLLVRLN